MKLIYSLLALVAFVGLTACSTSESKKPLSSGGDAYKEVDNISRLYILPVELPDDIHGDATQLEKSRAREDWPTEGSRLIARGVSEETGDRVTASAREYKPKADFYFKLTITYLNVGDAGARATNLISTDVKGWSQVLATGRIIRADTGETVAELNFNHSSGLGSKESFQNDMTNLGKELGNWITSRQ